MADEHPREFPDISKKLAAPKKLSAFERGRHEKEAKKKKAAEEEARALKEFEESFAADDDDAIATMAIGGRPPQPPRGPRGSGLGLLDDDDYNYDDRGVQPPPAKKKRALDEMREREGFKQNQGVPTYDRNPRSQYGRAMSDDNVDRDDDRRSPERAAPKATMQLSMMPLGTTPDQVKDLLKPFETSLTVDQIEFQAPTQPGFKSRHASCIVTLAEGTSYSDVDAAVTALSKKYLGCGHNLSISRHLSSTVLHPSLTGKSTNVSQEPFGARLAPSQYEYGPMRNAPPPNQRGYAPPAQFAPTGPGQMRHNRRPNLQVCVRPPRDATTKEIDMKTMKTIHAMVDAILTEETDDDATEFEAMMMERDDVQHDENYAFLWDSRSPAGVYYRWRLWEGQRRLYTEEADDDNQAPKNLFDVDIDWIVEDEPRFQQVTAVSDFLSDDEYDDEEFDSDDEGGGRKFNRGRPRDEESGQTLEKSYLDPIWKAKLVDLLARLPTSYTKLRRGDVARITNFSILHAAEGAEEVVQLLCSNIERPVSLQLAAKYGQEINPAYDPADAEDALPTIETEGNRETSTEEKKDINREESHSTRIIALYVISDLFHASAQAGGVAKNLWRYRPGFEQVFTKRKTFEFLGRLEKELGMGKITAQKYKTRVNNLLNMWQEWSVFNKAAHEHFQKTFNKPPLTAEEQVEADAEATRREHEEAKRAEAKRKVDEEAKKAEAEKSRPAQPPALSRFAGIKMNFGKENPFNKVESKGEPMEDVQPFSMSVKAAVAPKAKVAEKDQDMFAEDSD